MLDDLTAPYLVCKHLEQNGLYDESYADEGYHLDWPSPAYREAHKVQRRSGASSVLNTTRNYHPELFETLRTAGCIVEEAGEVALRTGFWRHRLADVYGYDPMFREGWYSVPQTYVPSENLATETYENYARGGVRRSVAVETITSTSVPEKYVDEADRIFDESSASEQALFRVLNAEARFTSGVHALRSYAATKEPSITDGALV